MAWTANGDLPRDALCIVGAFNRHRFIAPPAGQ